MTRKVWLEGMSQIGLFYFHSCHQRVVYPGTAKLALHHLELTCTEEIPKGMVKLVFQLKSSLSKDQHLAQVS